MVYETIAETATPGLDFTAKSDTVTWGDGETGIKFIDVDISDDDLAESDETFRIRLSNPTGGATINGSEVQVEIRDDDSADDDAPSDDDPPDDEGGGGGGSDGLFLLGLLLTGLARSRIQSARPPPMH